MSFQPYCVSRVVAVRFVHFEDLGTLGDVLVARGATIDYIEAGVDDFEAIDTDGVDLLVILGGPIGADDDAVYPWLTPLRAIVAARARRDLPTLGICLGAQLIASALDAKVYAGPQREIGWFPLSLTEAGASSPMKHVGPVQCTMFHWHGDTFDLPVNATLLASSARYPNQAFRYGNNVLALQCHPEVKRDGFERWLIGHAAEIGSTPGLEVNALRADTAAHAARLERQATRMFEEWLDGLAAVVSRKTDASATSHPSRFV